MHESRKPAGKHLNIFRAEILDLCNTKKRIFQKADFSLFAAVNAYCIDENLPFLSRVMCNWGLLRKFKSSLNEHLPHLHLRLFRYLFKKQISQPKVCKLKVKDVHFS